MSILQFSLIKKITENWKITWDSSNQQNIQIIVAKKGMIINEDLNKYLILNDGKIINTNLEKRSTIFDFKETVFDLGKYQTKTTTDTKI